MLAEALALTTYSAVPEVEYSELGPDAASYEFEQANTDASATSVSDSEGLPGPLLVNFDLSPEATRQANRIVSAVELLAPNATLNLDAADDGSLLIEVTDEATRREVLFAISPKSAKVYFSASETPSLNGIVTLQPGLESLLRWVAEGAQISKKSLLLPSE